MPLPCVKMSSKSLSMGLRRRQQQALLKYDRALGARPLRIAPIEFTLSVKHNSNDLKTLKYSLKIASKDKKYFVNCLRFGGLSR